MITLAAFSAAAMAISALFAAEHAGISEEQGRDAIRKRLVWVALSLMALALTLAFIAGKNA